MKSVSGRVALAQGTAGRLEIDRSLVADSRDCLLQFNVSGDTATLVPHECRETVPPTDIERMMDFASWAMTSPDGQSLTLSETHTVAISIDALVCTTTTQGELERVWYETAIESEPNDMNSPNGPFDHDTLVSGAIEPSGDDDVFAIANRGSQSVSVRLQTHGSALGSCGINTMLVVFDEQNNELAQDDDGGQGSCSLVNVTIEPGATVNAAVLGYMDEETIATYHLEIDFPGDSGSGSGGSGSGGASTGGANTGGASTGGANTGGADTGEDMGGSGTRENTGGSTAEPTVTDLGETCSFDCPPDGEYCCTEASDWCFYTASEQCDSGACLGSGPEGGHCSKPCTSDADCTGGTVPMACLVSCDNLPAEAGVVGVCWDEATYAAISSTCGS